MAKTTKQRAGDADLLTVSRAELLRGGSDRAFRDMVHEMLHFAHHLGKIRDAFARVIGVTAIQYEILLRLRHAGPDAQTSVSELAQLLQRSRPFTVIEVGRLAARGLVEKRADPNDGRRVFVHLTDSGFALLREVAAYQRQTNDVLFGSLGADDLDRLRAMLPALNDDALRAAKLLDFLTTRAGS